MLELIIQGGLILVIIGGYEWRLRTLTARMSFAPSRNEVKELIDLKLEVVKVQHDDLREDIKRLETKIDLLISNR